MRVNPISVFLFLACNLLLALPVYAQFSHSTWGQGGIRLGDSITNCDANAEGGIRYKDAANTVEFCNGTAWIPMAQVQTTPGPTAPGGSGYFVLTDATWNGNLGGLTGADAKCLTELGTTHTSWRGYSAANSNGQITASKVYAFLCDQSTCNNLMPLTTYYFAYAGNGTPGGAFFTTDSTGRGPNDANAWSAANYFSGTYTYWMSRQDYDGAGIDNQAWFNGPAGNVYSPYYSCTSWTDSDPGNQGAIGNSSLTDAQRWWSASSACNTPRRLICFVNP